MAEKWYPVIDYTACIACGTCADMCSHGVYDTAKAPMPVVKNPGGCIDHCHGCGDACPAGAIVYVGEDTTWTPPNGSRETGSACRSCSGETSPARKVLVEYLYLDLQTCDRCIGTEHVLDEVMAVLIPALKLAGFAVTYRKTEIETAGLAETHRVLSSPTIRVNGRDVCETVREDSCGCCSEISGTDVACRVFEYYGEVYKVPPKELLANGVLQAVFGSLGNDCSSSDYELPENLRIFFAGKGNKSICSCGKNCC